MARDLAPHCIRRQTVELTLVGVRDSFPLANELGRICRERMPGLLEAAFDGVSADGKHRRITRLEVDLGVIPAADLEAQVLQRLQGATTRSLQEALSAGRASEVGDALAQRRALAAGARGEEEITVETVDAGQRDAEILRYFLQTGVLPWFADAATGKRLQSALDAELEADARGFVAWLAGSARTVVAERLARQFSAASIVRLLRSVAAAEGAAVLSDLDEVLAAARAVPESPQAEAPAVLQEFAEALLGRGAGVALPDWRERLAIPLHPSKPPGAAGAMLAEPHEPGPPGDAAVGAGHALDRASAGDPTEQTLRAEGAELRRGDPLTAADHPTASLQSEAAAQGELNSEARRRGRAAEEKQEIASPAQNREDAPNPLRASAEFVAREGQAQETTCAPRTAAGQPDAENAGIPSPAPPAPASDGARAEADAAVPSPLQADAIGEPLPAGLGPTEVKGDAWERMTPPAQTEDVERALPGSPRPARAVALASASGGSQVEIPSEASGRGHAVATAGPSDEALARTPDPSPFQGEPAPDAEARDENSVRALPSLATAAANGRTVTSPVRDQGQPRLGSAETVVGPRPTSQDHVVADGLDADERSSPSPAARAGERPAGTGSDATASGAARLPAPQARQSPLIGVHQRASDRVSSPDPTAPAAYPDGIWVENAGLPILHPFLRAFFEAVGVMADGCFKSFPLRCRAVCLLQWVVLGGVADEEHRLPLCKILCGLPVETPTRRIGAPTSAEQAEAEALLRHTISQWSALRNTSVDGFRRSFLQRQGLLERNEQGWKLRMEARPYDVLFERLPWGFEMVKTSFMTELLRVTR